MSNAELRNSIRVVVAVVTWALPAILGLAIDPASNAQADIGSLPSFEVVSIKPDTNADDYRGTHSHLNLVGSRYIGTGLTAKNLIEFAYGIEDFELAGGPSWIDSDKYNIDAKIDDATFGAWQKLPAD